MPPTDLTNPPNFVPAGTSPPLPPVESPLPREMIPTEDGVPLESHWHRIQINLLLAVIDWHRRGRNDFFAGGNMFVHHSEERVRNRDTLGPDVLLVNGVSRDRKRECWVAWEEGGRLPDFIVELMSPTTRHLDLTHKFEIYERIFQTKEYVAYDPGDRKINAWRLDDGRYRPIGSDSNGRYFLEQVGLSIGPWVGTVFGVSDHWLRFYDERGAVVPLKEEAEEVRADVAEARVANLTAEIARLKAQLQKGPS